MNILVPVMLLAMQAATVGNPPGSISGRLVNRDGAPAADARVVAIELDEGATAQALMSLARTDANGRYRLEDVPPGRYLIAAGSIDALSYFPGVMTRTAATVVDIKSGTTLTGIDFRWLVIPPIRVSGRLIFEGVPRTGSQIIRLTSVNVAGLPAGGAINRPGAARSLNIGEDGVFEFQNVLPGAYQLSFSGGGLDIPIVVEDRDITGMELPVRGQVMVSQSVAVEHGDPLPAIELVLTDLKFNAVPSIVRAGYPSMALPLWTGDYHVEIRGLPPGFFVKSMTSGSRDLRIQPLEVRAAGIQTVIAVTLGVSPPPPWVTLNGRVTGDGAVAVSQVIAVGSALQEGMSTSVSKDGAFVFTKLLPGHYTISAVPRAEPLPAAVRVNVRADSAPVELAVRAMKRVAGRVVVVPYGSYPLRIGFEVNCPSSPGSDEVSAKISVPLDPDGTFSVILPTTGCRIGLDRKSLLDHHIEQNLTYGVTELVGDALFNYADSAELKIMLAPGIPVTGQLARIEPAARRIVFRRHTMLQPAEGIQAAIDAEGRFALSVPSGTYLATLDVDSVIPIPSIELSVGVSNTTTGIVIALPPLRSVVVRTLAAGGRPPASFILRVGGSVAPGRGTFSTGPQFASPAMEYHGNRADITPSADGTVHLLLPEGSYWLLADFPEDIANPPSVKSFTSGAVNLKTSPLIVADRDLEITVVFETEP